MRRHEVVVHLGSTGNNNKLNFLFRPWLLFIMMVKFWKKKYADNIMRFTITMLEDKLKLKIDIRIMYLASLFGL